jgi:hypothetical protein
MLKGGFVGAVDRLGYTGAALCGIGLVLGGVVATTIAVRFSKPLTNDKLVNTEAHSRGASLQKSLTTFEQQLSKDLVQHADVQTNFEDIGGLEAQINELQELVILPLSHPHLYAHSAVAQQPTVSWRILPKWIPPHILYTLVPSPPGCVAVRTPWYGEDASGTCHRKERSSVLPDRKHLRVAEQVVWRDSEDGRR